MPCEAMAHSTKLFECRLLAEVESIKCSIPKGDSECRWFRGLCCICRLVGILEVKVLKVLWAGSCRRPRTRCWCRILVCMSLRPLCWCARILWIVWLWMQVSILRTSARPGIWMLTVWPQHGGFKSLYLRSAWLFEGQSGCWIWDHNSCDQ